MKIRIEEKRKEQLLVKVKDPKLIDSPHTFPLVHNSAGSMTVTKITGVRCACLENRNLGPAMVVTRPEFGGRTRYAYI